MKKSNLHNNLSPGLEKLDPSFSDNLGEPTEDEKMWYMALWGRDWDEDYPQGSEEKP